MDVFVAVVNVKEVDKQIRFACYSETERKKLKALSHHFCNHFYVHCH